MPTQITSGSTTTDGTEQTLFTDTSNANCVLVIDTFNMALGDAIEVRLKTKTRSGDSSRQAYFATYANVQADPQKYSIPVPVNIEIVGTLKRVAGSDRAYPWALLSL